MVDIVIDVMVPVTLMVLGASVYNLSYNHMLKNKLNMHWTYPFGVIFFSAGCGWMMGVLDHHFPTKPHYSIALVIFVAFVVLQITYDNFKLTLQTLQ